MKMKYDDLQLSLTEAELATAFNTSIADVRNNLTDPSPTLCSAAIKELVYEQLDRNKLCRKYKVTIAEIDRALYRSKPHLSDDDLQTLYLTKSVKEIARRYKVSVKNIEKRLGLTLANKIEASPNLPPAQLAMQLGVPVTTVYHYRSTQGITRTYRNITTEQWIKILNGLKTNSISELAALYGISRAAIYKQVDAMKKRKLITEETLQKITEEVALGVPLAAAMRHSNLSMSRPAVAKLVKLYEDPETHVSLFPDWLVHDEQEVSAKYVGYFPYGGWE